MFNVEEPRAAQDPRRWPLTTCMRVRVSLQLFSGVKHLYGRPGG